MNEISGPEAQWRNALSEGRFLLQKCRRSGTHVFPPRILAPGTGEDELDWVEASGGGTVYSTTVVSPKPPSEPYTVVLVDLDEGPRMMSKVEGMAAQDVAIGLRVKARIASKDGVPIVVFVPA